MSNERPTAEELRQGMAVEIVQDDADPQSEDTEPIIGEIGTVYGDEPEGPHVKLKVAWSVTFSRSPPTSDAPLGSEFRYSITVPDLNRA